MIRVRTLRMVSDLRPARLALSGALSRRSRELIEHSRRRMHDGHGWRDAGSRLEPHRRSDGPSACALLMTSSASRTDAPCDRRAIFDHQHREA